MVRSGSSNTNSDKNKFICADCGFSDPTWAIVNRGLLICEDCCSVHRSLGRHVSQLKSLSNSRWRPSQLNMVYMLNNSSINSLWEHSLSDPKCSRKKPQQNDPIYPVKEDFIRAKHIDLAFALKSRSSNDQEDLNQQLHSSVRTSNLETSLRLLLHGADANYFHREKGNFVVHVAAHAGQMEQFELLFSHGANSKFLDIHGNTPASCARMNGHLEIAENITECMYEVTDRFCYFLCKRIPDHKSGQHFLIPDISDCTITPLLSKEAQIKTQQLTDPVFDGLLADVYDEVDRRENESICKLSAAAGAKLEVPFLPVNPNFPAVRNQGRQKLAKLTDEEFCGLVYDILVDMKRRKHPLGNYTEQVKNELDDEPLYDTVASDEDYVSIDQLLGKNEEKDVAPDTKTENADEVDASDKASASEQISELESKLNSQMVSSDSKITELLSQVSELQKEMDALKEENVLLKIKVETYEKEKENLQMKEDTEVVIDTDEVVEVKQRPKSLYNIAQQYIGTLNNGDRLTPPEAEEVLRRTNQVTKQLQELSVALRTMESKYAFLPYSDHIRLAVTDLSSIFPQGATDEVVRSAIRALNTNTIRLQAACSEVDSSVDQVRKHAYNMAKATRQILTYYQ